jgi:hypothetical protein
MILITRVLVANPRQLIDFLSNFCELVEPNPILNRVKREPTGIASCRRMACPNTGVAGQAFWLRQQ